MCLSNKQRLDQVLSVNFQTALDLFAELEQAGFLSSTNVSELHRDLLNMDQQLAMIVQRYMEQMGHVNDEEQPRILPRNNVDYEVSLCICTLHAVRTCFHRQAFTLVCFTEVHYLFQSTI